MLKQLLITLGDPFSVNIELLKKTLRLEKDLSIVVIGNYSHWQSQGPEIVEMTVVDSLPASSGLFFWNLGGPSTHASELDKLSRGQQSIAPLEVLRSISENRRLAVLTMPIDKSACQLAGFQWTGHTEYFSEIWKGEALMLLAGPRLRVALSTHHVALKEVGKHLNPQLVERKIRSLYQAMILLGVSQRPKIAVAGINPHLGDQGLFGKEEQEWLQGLVTRLAKELGGVYGPLPADTVFYQAYQGQFDSVLAMYHDQGLAPLKTVHFFDAVNISAGLKHMRLSPDHGPAADLFGKGLASSLSTSNAIKMAIDYLRNTDEAKSN